MKRWMFLAAVFGGVSGAGATALWMDFDSEANILFPGKIFLVSDGSLVLEGSIVGEGRNRPANNFISLHCVRDDESCDMFSLTQLGPEHIGSVVRESVRIEEWSGNVIRLTSKMAGTSPAQPCNYFEIRIDPHSGAATYTRFPNGDADRERCSDLFASNDEVMQWQIDDGYRRKEMHEMVTEGE